VTAAGARRVLAAIISRALGVRPPRTFDPVPAESVSGFRIWLETYDDAGNVVSKERR
jgi:hypothetical protein